MAPGILTDGQCVARNGVWSQRGSLDLFRPAARHGSLYLNGLRFEGIAPAEDPTGCSAHLHTMTYTPTETGRVPLRIWDPTGPSGDDGSLTVTFDRLSPVPLPPAAASETPASTKEWTAASETVTVAADEPLGSLTSLRFRAGQRVTLNVRGTTRVQDRRTADASCVVTDWKWTQDPDLPSGQDLFGLTVDGANVAWRTSQGNPGCSSTRHRYQVSLVVTKSGPLRLAVADLDYSDNGGTLTVSVQRG